jgi:hypothetical protein
MSVRRENAMAEHISVTRIEQLFVGNVVPFNHVLWIYVNIALVPREQARQKHRRPVAIWIGHFQSEEARTRWRSEFEAALERYEVSCEGIRCTVTSRKVAQKMLIDIDPAVISPENAVLSLPRIVLEKIEGAM